MTSNDEHTGGENRRWIVDNMPSEIVELAQGAAATLRMPVGDWLTGAIAQAIVAQGLARPLDALGSPDTLSPIEIDSLRNSRRELARRLGLMVAASQPATRAFFHDALDWVNAYRRAPRYQGADGPMAQTDEEATRFEAFCQFQRDSQAGLVGAPLLMVLYGGNPSAERDREIEMLAGHKIIAGSEGHNQRSNLRSVGIAISMFDASAVLSRLKQRGYGAEYVTIL